MADILTWLFPASGTNPTPQVLTYMLSAISLHEVRRRVFLYPCLHSLLCVALLAVLWWGNAMLLLYYLKPSGAILSACATILWSWSIVEDLEYRENKSWVERIIWGLSMLTVSASIQIIVHGLIQL